MRRRAAVGALLGVGLAAIAFALGRTPQPERALVAAPAAHEPRSVPESPATAPEPALARNPFDYADVPPPSRAADSPRVSALAPAPTLMPEPPVRLTGFVRKGGKVRAALFVRGEMVLLGIGEASNGFTLLAADEDSGVRLRDPQGAELVLAVEP